MLRPSAAIAVRRGQGDDRRGGLPPDSFRPICAVKRVSKTRRDVRQIRSVIGRRRNGESTRTTTWGESTMIQNLNRRELLLASGAAWLGAGGVIDYSAPSASRGPGKKVLFFTKSSGFQHSVDHPQGRQARPRRADPDRDRQGARLRGRRLARTAGCSTPTRSASGTPSSSTPPATSPRPAPTRRPPMSADGEKAFYDAIQRRQGLHRHALRDRHLRPLRSGTRGPTTRTSR